MSAFWQDDLNGIEITFDKDIQDVPIVGGNWTLRVGGRRRRLLDPNVFGGNKIASQTSPFGIPTPQAIVGYSAVVPDVIGVNNQPVEAFQNFPVNQV